MTDAITEPLPARSAADVSSGDRRVLLITGMSGAGKTSALKALEDLGYEAIDHVPLSLLKRLVPSPGSVERPIAIGVDVRTRDFGVERFIEEVDHLAGMDSLDVRVAFLDCEDDELRRRYTETRHRHPLAEDRTVADGIAREREMLTSLRSRADVTIDTSNLAGGELKRILDGHFGLLAEAALSVFVTSFAYRNGLPREADLVFDVRFLANPHYDPALRPMTGREEPIAAYVSADPVFFPVLRRPDRPVDAVAAALRRRGEKLPHHRRRLHGRTPQIRFHCRTAGSLARNAGPRRPHSPPRAGKAELVNRIPNQGGGHEQ